jgi:hypothetical protein
MYQHARITETLIVAWCAAVMAFALADVRAQDLVDPESPDAIVERYMQLHGLDELRAVQLRERLARGGTAEERLAIAERLGEIYAQMLSDTMPAAARQELERLSKELLAAVPSMDSFALRIKLAKAQYLQAERTAERWGLRLIEPAEAAEAQRVLAEVNRAFSTIGTQVNLRIAQLEGLVRRTEDGQIERVREQLAEAQADRSSAMYYSGWSGLWLATMSGGKAEAARAKQDLGWLIGAEGQSPSVDLLEHALLSYEHVARAALAIAMCQSVEGNHVVALEWFRSLRDSQELHVAVREQLFSREVGVLAKAHRWDQALESIKAQKSASGGTLKTIDARLVAVVAMEGAADAKPQDDRVREAIAAEAIADLISAGEVGHVLDLLRRYGTLPIGGDGFIVRYARGLLAYDEARKAHREGEADDTRPTTRSEVASKYKQASDLLEPAFEASDSARFAQERARCSLTVGLCHYYRGRNLDAAHWCERAATLAAEPERREEALWLALVALDLETAERASEEARQGSERLSVLYMREFPQTERAAMLLLRSSDATEVDTQRSIEVLFAVKPESPLYESARRHLGRLLYREYRRAGPDRRDAEAARFLSVAEELLELDVAEVAQGDHAEAVAASQAVVVRVRQILDVVLASRAPELARADRALELLERVANQMGLGLAEFEGELAYRRLQLALLRGLDAEVDAELSQLTRIGGRFARAADRLLYRHWLDRWARPDAGEAEARSIVRYGGRILATPDDETDRLTRDALLGVADRVSEAAELLWEKHTDQAMRSLAVRVTRSWFEEGKWTEPMVRRLARLAESEGDKKLAFEAWNTLSAAFEVGEEAWFECRYEAMRLLVEFDPQGARAVVAQHGVLFPSFGPQPWGEKIQALSARLELLPRIEIPQGARP